MVRGIDSSLNPLNVPYALRQMKGGVASFDTANELLSFIISYNKIKESAYETIQSHFARSAWEESNSPVPPTYFKLGQLHEINEGKQEIHITLGNSMPVANTGDGIAVNKKAARILLDLYGIKSPDFGGAAHIASGVVKRMATSKTMNVPEITILYETLR